MAKMRFRIIDTILALVLLASLVVFAKPYLMRIISEPDYGDAVEFALPEGATLKSELDPEKMGESCTRAQQTCRGEQQVCTRHVAVLKRAMPDGKLVGYDDPQKCAYQCSRSVRSIIDQIKRDNDRFGRTSKSELYNSFHYACLHEGQRLGHIVRRSISKPKPSFWKLFTD
ncbi:MAG TPA: hypothetical protein DFI00_00865 [Rhodospirillaceae bacterium]|nr:hypothetical protein [Alphaproteobacteria bacterium]HCI45823.1 hypothetical protein [Rhodospirillaceae bacterium]|tara:strand:- start:158 stop:670 length:513 start_codon:yes stop_codon:yes gene_type:complete